MKDKCIRQVTTFSCIKPEYKFDNIKFNPFSLKLQLPTISPKFISLLNNIKELDKKDLENYATTFKHIIYCDLDGVHGIKMIASGLIANGYKYAENDKNSFELLTSSTLYSKPMKVSTKKDILNKFNDRDNNIYGNKVRFLLLDVGFKEGIDVFDVKYIHMFEPSKTLGDEKQIIGRGTRFCGQKGLPYENGWKLHVYKYDMENENGKSVHEIFMENTGLDLSKINLENELNQLIQFSSIDKGLTHNIHNTKEPKVIKEIHVKSIFGKLFQNNQDLDCKLGCFGPLRDFSKELLYIGVLLSSNNDLKKKINQKNPKPIICHRVETDRELCAIYNKIWKNEEKFIKKNKDNILYELNKNRKNLNKDIYNLIQSYLFKNIESPTQKPSLKPLNFEDTQKYIKFHFQKLKWPKSNLQNSCITNGGSEIVNFSPTQNFVRKYFIPSNPYKGILLNHSVGTGKTCSGVAIASNSFQKEGYTILWVTRTTLKGEMIKNMFDKVCSLIIKENIEAGIEIPKNLKDRKLLMGKQWLPDISYKQFANMLKGKNILFKKMQEINGKHDILHKTLIIIDEVHKLFSNDLKPQERPDIDILKQMIHRSYALSGKDSVRLVCMTATPITTDVMGFVKLMNLLDDKNQLPEDYDEFKKQYCNENGNIVHDMKLIEKLNGKISYLNRETDITTFALPVFHETIKVPISRKIENNIIQLEEELKTTKNKKEIKKRIKDMKTEIKNDCSVENKLLAC